MVLGAIGVAMAMHAHLEQRMDILAILKACGANQKKTSTVLGISKSTLWRKLKEYGVEASQLGPPPAKDVVARVFMNPFRPLENFAFVVDLTV